MSAASGSGSSHGELAIVLHTHMPYVEGFGTWPFGEEWLWEAMATSYLPLLDVLEAGAPLTLSLTPVLCDQLAADGIGERFERFLIDVRRTTHRLDSEGLRNSGAGELAAEVERAAGDYERALARFESIGGDLLGALAAHVSWTSSATHAVLPLCATDAGARLQIEGGIAAHGARFGDWGGGFWLPECAYAAWLEPLLEAAGVRACCVELTDHFGLGAPEQLRPLRSPGGPLLVPIDRELIDRVWGEGGYPAHAGYRDYHRQTFHHHRVWANDGSPYDHAHALELTRVDAADFVARARERVAGGGLAVFAIDTELLGHWWYEGVAWLEAVIAEAARQGLALVRLDEALERHAPLEIEHGALGVSSWGEGRDLSTWDGPAVAELAFATRAAELRVVAAAAGYDAVRQLLALQSSDWAFLSTRRTAGNYPEQRAAAHARALTEVLAQVGSPPDGIHNIAPHATVAPLLEP